MLRAGRDQVVAFRLAGHNLARRLPRGSLLEAAAACGIPSYPPGSAALALAARVDDLLPGDLDRALGVERCLLQVRSVRSTPLIFPTDDAWVFTAGLLPESEAALRYFIRGAEPALDRVGLGASALVELVEAELLDVLDGRELSFARLSAELTERVALGLPPDLLAEWRSPSPYASRQELGEALVHFALYAVSLKGIICYAPAPGAARRRDGASFARIDQWLGRPLSVTDPDRARAELVRRYLRCYGPSSAEDFGEWAGISPASARLRWRLVEPDLLPVSLAGRVAWLHRHDLADFESPPAPEGVRLLPPHDAFLAQRDRDLLLADAAARRRVWRAAGSPGVVLAGGLVSATWRARKQGKRLAVAVEPLAALDAATRSGIADEASRLAPFRGCEVAEVSYAE